MKTNGFLNPEAIRTLINANTDSHAPHFTFMTTHGTILGHDAAQDIKAVRKFGAFAGTTWLRHSKAIAETGQASLEPDFGLNGQTLKVVIGKEGKGLQGLVVRVDEMVGAVCVVKERTLLAAQMERRGFVGETDEVAGLLLEGWEDGGNEDGAGTTNGADLEGEHASSNDHHHPEDGNDTDGASSGLSNGSELEGDLKGKEAEDLSSTSSTSSNEGKLPKIRILEIRAEAMAKVFADEICGPEFRMPPDFK